MGSAQPSLPDMHFRYTFPWLSIQTVLAVSLPFADIDPSTQLNKRSLAYSEPHYPSPWMDPKAIGWEEAYEKAKAFVSQLTLLEKVNLTTGIGYVAHEAHPIPYAPSNEANG